jgi:hypothetical protein
MKIVIYANIMTTVYVLTAKFDIFKIAKGFVKSVPKIAKIVLALHQTNVVNVMMDF